MVNDLSSIIELMCKLFADDTTLVDFDSDLDSHIKCFVEIESDPWVVEL